MVSLFEQNAPRPLADRLRPRKLEEVVGQDHLIGPEAPIGRMLKNGQISSMILWGPPGCGKTTMARLLAEDINLAFEEIDRLEALLSNYRPSSELSRISREAGSAQIGRAHV